MGLFDSFKNKTTQKEKVGKFASANLDDLEENSVENNKSNLAGSQKKLVSDSEIKKQDLMDRRKQQMRDKAMGHVKKDLGVCIPNHAKSPEERKKLPRREISPFDKLRMQHEKDDAEIDRELSEISAQAGGDLDAAEVEFDVNAIDEEKETLRQNPLSRKASISFERADPERGRTTADRKAALEREVMGVIANRAPFGSKKKENVNSISNYEKPLFEPKAEEFDEIEDSIEKVDTYIPKFSKTAREKFASEKASPNEPKAYGSFTVTGVYPGGDTTIISGEVTSGKVNKRMSAQCGKISLRVNEIKKGMEQTNELYLCEQGSIFVRGTVNTIKYGDVLEFS